MFPVNCLGPGRNTQSLVVISFTLSTYLVGLYLPDASQTKQGKIAEAEEMYMRALKGKEMGFGAYIDAGHR